LDEEESGFCCWVGLRREQRLPIVDGGVGVHAEEWGVCIRKRKSGEFFFVG